MNEDQNIPYDAQQLAEDIEEGERVATNVDTNKDYERAQQYATSSPDGSAVDPEEANAPGNPELFRDMARDAKTPENL